MPFLIGHNLFKKTSVSSGVAIANNKEFNQLDFRANYNLRISFLFKVNYFANNKLDIILLLQKNISNVPDLYLVNQPNMDLSTGIAYKLF